MEVIKLNLIPGKACPIVHASQFDDGRDFKAELYEGVNVYTLDGTETLTAIVKKPDGNEVTAAVTNTSDNYVIITTTEQMTACAGGNLGTLRIEKGAVTIATLNFILECQASPDTGIQSDSEIHNLEAQVNQMVEDAVAEQYDSNNVLFDTAPTSGHGVPYAVTSGGLWSWIRDLPLIAYPTASGSIATFDTSLALPLQDCTIAINTNSGVGGANIQRCNNAFASLWDIDSSFKGSVEFNQIIPTASKDYTNSSTDTRAYFAFQIASITPTITYFSKWINEVGVLSLIIKPSSVGTGLKIKHNGQSLDLNLYINSTETLIANHVYMFSIDCISVNPTISGGVITENLQLFDLTQMFGSTIADYIYSLEQATEGAGVAFFKSLYPNDYYAYDSGTSELVGDNLVYVDWSSLGTITEGSLDVTNGKLTVTTGSMASGDYQIIPNAINQISGSNNIYADTGNTSVVYACSLKDYIDSQ